MSALLSRIERSLMIVARIVDIDETALPIFVRLDAEYQAEAARVAATTKHSALARARALAQVKEVRA